MLSILIAVYRANPFRPHCGGAKEHVWLCRLLKLNQVNDGSKRGCDPNS